jgi:hypothetical protein
LRVAEEGDRLRAQHFVVVEMHHPVVAAQRQRGVPRFLDGGRPWNGDDLVGVALADGARAVGGGFVDDDQVIGKADGAQAGLDEARAVVSDDKSTYT